MISKLPVLGFCGNFAKSQINTENLVYHYAYKAGLC